jgi:hypothetical protein
MTFYNITQMYLAQLDDSLLSRYKRWVSKFNLDGYHADSLNEAIEGFKQSPPLKCDRQLKVPSAFLYLENLEVRLLDPERAKKNFGNTIYPDEDDKIPYFELKDKTSYRLGMYCSLSETEFYQEVQNFDLDYNIFRTIPITLIQYIHRPDSNQLIIKGFGEKANQRPKVRRRTKIAKEKCDFGVLNPIPAW